MNEEKEIKQEPASEKTSEKPVVSNDGSEGGTKAEAKQDPVQEERANKLAAKKAELAERKKLLEEEKEIVAEEKAMNERKASAGESEAGVIVPKEDPDEKWAREAKERYKGTGLDPTPDDSETTYS